MASLAEKRVADDEATPADPQSRPEELRLLEALLFASAEPIDQATLAKRMPELPGVCGPSGRCGSKLAEGVVSKSDRRTGTARGPVSAT